MPVNFKQYRGTVGVFNNYNLLFRKTQIITKKSLKSSPNYNSDIASCTYNKMCNIS